MLVGDKLISVNGEDLSVDDCYIEECEVSTTVYNFQVEDYHTYFVGENKVWVHNADCVGANGTQISSETVWKNGKTERIDVENSAPGIRDGNLHYHDHDNRKYYYDIKEKTFFDAKTGMIAPKKIQKLLNNSDFIKGIKKGLKYLGEL